MQVTFEEVSVKAIKRWTDENGKRRQKTKTFSQTVNPFNKNSDGTIKTHGEIMREISAERDAWMRESD